MTWNEHTDKRVRALLNGLDAFLHGTIDFDALISEFDARYHDLPEGVLTESEDRFFDELEDKLEYTGDWGQITVEEFKRWLEIARDSYPFTPP